MAFEKGQSGNPGGRPKEDPEVKRLAQEASPKAIAKLIEWIDSENPKASISACNSILDRAYGKPPQALTGADGGPMRVAVQAALTDEAL